MMSRRPDKRQRGTSRRRRGHLSPSLVVLATVLLTCTPARVLFAQSRQDAEAKRPFVNKIIFEGNRYFSSKKLRSQMHTKESTFFSIFRKPRLNTDVLQRDIAVLEATYHSNGFLDAQVRLEELEELEGGTFVNIIIKVTENEPTRVDLVTFRHTGIISDKDLKKDLLLEKGDPYNPSLVGSDISTIKLKYFDRGYLAVVVQDSVYVEGRRVTIDYAIDPGPIISIRSINIVGNRLTKDSIVEKETTLRVGHVFSLKEAVETQRNLFETGLFSEADVIPDSLDIATRTVAIVVRVRERKSKYFEVGFGVGNIVGSRVTAGWGDRNLFGTGRTLRFGVEYAFAIFPRGEEFGALDPRVRYYRYDLSFAQRRILGTKVLAVVTAFAEKDATVENLVVWTNGLAIGGGRHVGRNTDLVAGFTLERIKNLNITGETFENTHSVGTSLQFDTRDFILDPTRGAYRDIGLVVAGGILGGDNDFYTISSTVQRYWPVWMSRVFALRLRVGYADSYGQSPVVPVQNRFFTGGGNSVRGYAENSIGPTEIVENVQTGLPEETVVGGDVFLLTNVELRFGLPWLSRWNFSGAIFADGGNVWEDLGAVRFSDFNPFKDRGEVDQADYRYSIGLGIRYNTPLGPIRLDYGYPLVVEEGMDGSGRFNFSLGQIF